MNFTRQEKQSLVAALYSVVQADGSIDLAEMEYFKGLAEALELDNDLVEEAFEMEGETAIAYLRNMSQDKKRLVVFLMNKMSKADGHVDENEKQLIASLYHVIGVEA